MAEYKAVNGDVFRIEFTECPMTEDTIGELKKCFCVVDTDRLKILVHLQKLGLLLFLYQFCECYDSKDKKCHGCRLFTGAPDTDATKNGNTCQEGQRS